MAQQRSPKGVAAQAIVEWFAANAAGAPISKGRVWPRLVVIFGPAAITVRA